VQTIGAAAVVAKTMMPKPATAGEASEPNEVWQDEHHKDYDDYGDSHCFLRGTKIDTGRARVRVERVKAGDLLLTHAEGWRAVQRVLRFDSTQPPVCIAGSAFAPMVPEEDLFVSRGHAILIDGMLVTAGSLVNGRSIRIADEIKQPEYYHLAFAEHELISVHNLWCESYVEGREADMDEVIDLGLRGQMASHLRSAVSPWFDCRTPIDLVRNRIEERALAL
jgi:hypothetical protein